MIYMDAEIKTTEKTKNSEARPLEKNVCMLLFRVHFSTSNLAIGRKEMVGRAGIEPATT